MKYYESHSRSITKTITYRILIIISTGCLSYYFTQNIHLTIAITSASTIINTLLYFFHERFWNNIHWGKNKFK